MNPRASQSVSQPSVEKSAAIVQGVGQSQQQQVSRPSDDVGDNPRPIQAPRNHQPIGNNNPDDNNQEDKDQSNNIAFIQRNGGVIEPADANDLEGENEARKNLPLPYINKKNSLKIINDSIKSGRGEVENVANEMESDQDKPVLPMPHENRIENLRNAKSSTKTPNDFIPFLKPQIVEKLQLPDENQRNIESPPRGIDVDNFQKRNANLH